jgi:hypothetical protein
MEGGSVSDDSLREPPIYQDVLTLYLDLYANQPPRQAELVIPGWALERLNALPEDQRKLILGEIDQLAASHGLLTPTQVIVVP